MSVAVHLPEYTRAARKRFISDVASIVGAANIRAFYLPAPSEGLVVPDAFVAGRFWTHANTPAGRIKRLGKLCSLDFNGTTDYLTTPDAADLSFGNGTVDSAFSAFAAVNITDTALQRNILSKYATSQTEYFHYISTGDQLAFLTSDDSAAVIPLRASDAAAAQGAWTTTGFSYNGAGGATNQNGSVLYQNAVAIASTATNNAAYVAMEDKTAALIIGAQNAGASGFFAGSMGPVLLLSTLATLAQFAALHARCREYGLVA